MDDKNFIAHQAYMARLASGNQMSQEERIKKLNAIVANAFEINDMVWIETTTIIDFCMNKKSPIRRALLSASNNICFATTKGCTIGSSGGS